MIWIIAFIGMWVATGRWSYLQMKEAALREFNEFTTRDRGVFMLISLTGPMSLGAGIAARYTGRPERILETRDMENNT